MTLLEQTCVDRDGVCNSIFNSKPIGECEACGGDILDGEEGHNIPHVGLIHISDECLRTYFSQYRCIVTEGLYEFSKV